MMLSVIAFTAMVVAQTTSSTPAPITTTPASVLVAARDVPKSAAMNSAAAVASTDDAVPTDHVALAPAVPRAAAAEPAATPNAVAPAPAPVISLVPDTPIPLNLGDSEVLTIDEVRNEIRNMAWKKGEFRIVPYGTLWGDMSYDTQRAKIGDYCLWIESPTLHYDDPDFNIDAKSTRIGFDLFGPGLPCLCEAKVMGKVEVDFQGIFVTRNKPGLLLRHAYIEARSDEYRLLVGQTWDVISPLGIPTLNYTAGSGVGNLAYRRAQFRSERYWALSDVSMLTLQGSLNANVVTDYVSESGVSADPGPYPDIQVRGAVTLGQRTGPKAQPIVLGISAHCGEQNFDFRTDTTPDLGVPRTTWSVDADAYIPITERFGIQAEFFHGQNLSNYMGGILQGVDRVTHCGIHSTGGWIATWYKWRPDLCSNVGYSLDDPCNSDITMASGRTYNQMMFANLLYNATANLQLGFEVDVWKTYYKTYEPANAVRLDCAVKYSF